ncbi:hypothetical protein [Amycolatopsis sp. WGS_07]|uniref:hypothetical protein n=1 Tax=Amycolatopsis sp. WGS_07 TaxID=3076764 RepID=UPI0038737C32
MNTVLTFSEAIRTGHPAVIVVACLLLLLALFVLWLRRAQRPIPAPRGRPTVDDIRARLDTEKATRHYADPAETQTVALAGFRSCAEQPVPERAEEITMVIPKAEVAAVAAVRAAGTCRDLPDPLLSPREGAMR